MALSHLTLPVAPYRLSGTVYGCLFNHRPALAALGDAVHAAPYKAAPRAPVLYLKPRNTLAGDGASVVVPRDADELELGATLGLVIGRTACRVSESQAPQCVAACTIVADISVPHDSFYRPSVRLNARDGFCPIGPQLVPGFSEKARKLRLWVDGALVHESSTGDRIRSAALLLADVTEFMTLSPGDVLMLGVSAGAPRVRAGQRAVIEIEGLGFLKMSFVAEEKFT